MFNSENTFYKTFSGVDTLAFAMFPNAKPILLGSLTTISYSIYREKRPVPILGKINTGGYTRGMRSISGTLIFNLISQHFIRDLVEQIPYLKSHNKLKPDELPFFDIMIIAANEYGASSKMMIYGIDIFEGSQILSIQDILIENVIGFVARDIDDFEKREETKTIKSSSNKNNIFVKNINTSIFNNNYIDTKNIDIKKIQSIIFKDEFISGIYDNKTLEKIKEIQKKLGLNETGYLDNVTYNIILNNDKALKINSKSNVIVKDKNKNLIGIAYENDIFLYKKDKDDFTIDFYGHNGIVDLKKVKFLDKLENENGISFSKESVDDISKINIKNINENCKIVVNSIYKDNVSTNILYRNREFNLFKHSPNSFLFDIESKSYPKIIEIFIYDKNDKINRKEAYILSSSAKTWEEN